MMTNSKIRTRVILGVSLLVLFTASTLTGFTQSMTFSPYKIVLNAQGTAESFLSVIRMPIVPGYTLSGYDVELLVNDQYVADAYSFRYCYIDQNFLAEFDRMEVLNSPVVRALANTTAVATVRGSYRAVNQAGETVTVSFSTTASIEIVAPQKK